MDKIKRIPYGKADFEVVNPENRYYVDKTMYIPLLEETDHVFLIRPRRFGKSLFLSTLQSYYDILKKDKFEELFRDTWILKNPTGERAKYMILYFNFSMVSKDKNMVQKDFNDYCVKEINQFVRDYKEYLPVHFLSEIKKVDTAHEKMHIMATSLRKSKYKIYLLLDEYDNFTNTLLSDYGPEEYNKMARDEGFYKQFFTILKGFASGSDSGLARMFITGVSPVTMDDVTSGFNIGNNISNDKKFNTILGFTEKDVIEMIDYYSRAGAFRLDKEETLQIMKKWYNNYIFSASATEKVYNPDAILYFMVKTYDSNEIVEDLIDSNLRMDYGKLRHLVTIDKKLNGNFSRLKQVLEGGGIISEIITSFPYEQLTQQVNFVSLLYYFGLLTYSGEKKEDTPLLVIPNESIRKMMYEYIRLSLEDVGGYQVDILRLDEEVRKLAYRAQLRPVIEFIAEQISKQTSLRDFISGEKVVQTFYLSYLNIFDYYISLSEEENNKGYADMVLKPFTAKFPNIAYAWFIEFKYIHRTKNESELEEKLAEKIADSKKQLAQYEEDDFSKRMMSLEPYGKVKLKKGIVIFHGWELVYLEETP